MSFLRRNLKSCPHILKERAYVTLVQPHLERDTKALKKFNKELPISLKSTTTTLPFYYYQSTKMLGRAHADRIHTNHWHDTKFIN